MPHLPVPHVSTLLWIGNLHKYSIRSNCNLSTFFLFVIYFHILSTDTFIHSRIQCMKNEYIILFGLAYMRVKGKESLLTLGCYTRLKNIKHTACNYIRYTSSSSVGKLRLSVFLFKYHASNTLSIMSNIFMCECMFYSEWSVWIACKQNHINNKFISHYTNRYMW